MKTDAQVRQEVVAELRWEPSINAARISVEAMDGVVALAGHVETYAEKQIAERAARRVYGVRVLASKISIKLPETGRRTDADIARSAEHVLQLLTCLQEDSVKVQVEDGCVTLSGEVASEYQRKTAAEPICYLAGVMNVSNDIAIRSRISR